MRDARERLDSTLPALPAARSQPPPLAFFFLQVFIFIVNPFIMVSQTHTHVIFFIAAYDMEEPHRPWYSYAQIAVIGMKKSDTPAWMFSFQAGKEIGPACGLSFTSMPASAVRAAPLIVYSSIARMHVSPRNGVLFLALRIGSDLRAFKKRDRPLRPTTKPGCHGRVF